MREFLKGLARPAVHLGRDIKRDLAALTDPFSRFRGVPDQGFGCTTYAQTGEDLVIVNIFQLLGIHHPTYLDVGANDPIAGSNTALFYARGSDGTAIEANPHFKRAWARIRPRDRFLNIGIAEEPGLLEFFFFDDRSGRNTFDPEQAASFMAMDERFRVRKTATIETMRINDVVNQHLGGHWPDLLSLDIEGMDERVLRSAQFGETHPVVLCVETRDGAGNDVTELFIDIVRAKDYVPVFRTWGNLIAVRRWAARELRLG